MIRALRLAVAVVVALAAVVALLLFLQSRDKSQLDTGSASSAPGRALPDQGSAHRRPPPGFHFATDPPASGPHLPAPIRRDRVALSRDQLLHALELGDVVLAYGDPGDLPALRQVQEDVSGPFDPALAANGQMVVLDRRAGTSGVIALAWRRELRTATATDPALHDFADAWLGHGAAGQ